MSFLRRVIKGLTWKISRELEVQSTDRVPVTIRFNLAHCQCRPSLLLQLSDQTSTCGAVLLQAQDAATADAISLLGWLFCGAEAEAGPPRLRANAKSVLSPTHFNFIADPKTLHYPRPLTNIDLDDCTTSNTEAQVMEDAVDSFFSPVTASTVERPPAKDGVELMAPASW